MQKLEVFGANKLRGQVKISGSKNASLPILAATLLSNKKIRNTKKLYLMTTNKKLFYSQLDFKEVISQDLLIREM